MAGGLARLIEGGPLLEGTDLVAYELARNGVQDIANFLTGEPDEGCFTGLIIEGIKSGRGASRTR